MTGSLHPGRIVDRVKDVSTDPLLLLRGTAMMFASTLLLSAPLWLTRRDYPHTPIWTFLPQPPFPLDHVLLAAAVVCMAILVVRPQVRWALRVSLSIVMLWAILDQSRWQPYAIHYSVILGCFLIGDTPVLLRGGFSFLVPARLLLAGTYFYSGIQKINFEFVTWVFPRLVEPVVGRTVHDWPLQFQWSAGITVAVLEAAAGLSLLSGSRMRRCGAWILIAMHLSLLALIGPLGHGWNPIVWPWNVTMILALVVLFISDCQGGTRGGFRRGSSGGEPSCLTSGPAADDAARLWALSRCCWCSGAVPR